MSRNLLVPMAAAALLAFTSRCTPKAAPSVSPRPVTASASEEPDASAAPLSWPELAAKDPQATALCKELYPCRPGDRDDPPFMCALAGVRIVPAEHIPGLTVEWLSCPFRRLGLGALIGVPDDGSRPFLRDDALRARVRAYPRLRAMTSGAGQLDERDCSVVERDGFLRFCVKGVPFRGRHRCVINDLDSVACAQEAPERFLVACQRAHARLRVSADERYWGPGMCAVPSDHVRDGEVRGRVPTDPGTSQRGESAKIVLRAGGREVRVLSCGASDPDVSEDHLFVDGEAEPVTMTALLPRLDTDAMRATMLAQRVVGGEWAVLLDPMGGPDGAWPPNTCAFPPGPRRHGDKLDFYMTPSIPNRARVFCTADVKTAEGTCAPVPRGAFCE